MIEIWWRAEDKRYADYDPWAEFEQPTTSHLKITLTPYEVVRHTPRGVFLCDGTFVRGKAHKQWAVPTQELALRDLICRKKMLIKFTKHRLARAEEHLKGAENALARHQRT